MSQDIREYPTCRVDGDDHEARYLSVTATVGPTGDGEIDDTRGVQFTLETPSGYAYARVSEPQIRDLIDVLERRISPDESPEATGIDAEKRTVYFDGETDPMP